MSRLSAGRRLWLKSAVPVALFTMAIASSAAPAEADPGYQLASPSAFATSGEVPIGIAVDQASQNLYVAELTAERFASAPGQVEKLSAAGAPVLGSPFPGGAEDFFASVAVNPVNGDIYVYQAEASTPEGLKGKSEVSVLSSAGALKTSFAVTSSIVGAMAVDATGRLFLPSSSQDVIQILGPTGTLEGSVACPTCPGGGLDEPAGLAFDSAGKLYVADRFGGGRVVRLAPSGGGFAYETTLQAGAGKAGGPVAVAVDASSGDVLVGARFEDDYHVTAYDAGGAVVDDFGATLLTPFKAFAEAPSQFGQLAVNATTHRVYLTDPGADKVWIFDRIATIPAPTASTLPPSPLGQVESTLRASVDSKGHVLSSCHFEYTDDADFKANGFANAQSAPCPPLVGGPGSVTVTASVAGLIPNTSYDYRLLAADRGGSVETGPQAFKTLPPLSPEAVMSAPSGVTKNSATFVGNANPKGGAVSACRFEYVSEAAFQLSGFVGAASKICSSTPSGSVSSPVSAKVTDLSAGTAYRVRLVVTNNAGTTAAADKSFATAAETCAENPAVCPREPDLPELPPEPEILPVRHPAPKPLRCRKGFKKKRVHGKLKCVRAKKHRPQR